MTSPVRTCLWMEKDGEAAARFYTALIPGSAVTGTHGFKGGDVAAMVVEFHLAGTPYMILNGGPHFTLTPAASISVLTEDQAETDRLWAALTADGGQESQCGWLIDRWGLSWQITPREVMEMNFSDDAEASERARQAMYQMTKLDIAVMRKAYEGR
ncbi:VOC family protein [Paracoccus xiamenensis]|uniref:VOC family protein n=1 Tax=Paracoccus xiamenensis TaxID=2714901 RepID=UPI001408A762|nr:VOC family protein [Paracoccus xiamenensis]NHF73526.1 VOC family protein [Paracoccus xiamenensis]